MQVLHIVTSILNKMPLQGRRVYIVNMAIIIAAVFSALYGADLVSAGTLIGFALSGIFTRHTLSKSATQVGYANALLEQLVAAELERRAAEPERRAAELELPATEKAQPSQGDGQ